MLHWQLCRPHHHARAACGPSLSWHARACRFFLYFTDSNCALKYSAFNGDWGNTGPNSYLEWACFRVFA